jgi:Ran GTPase-activating protein (RanGAP) involved in mRNA processing and transport
MAGSTGSLSVKQLTDALIEREERYEAAGAVPAARMGVPTWMQMLDLSSNSLVDSDVTILARGLIRCRGLRALSLAHNSLSATGLAVLVDALLQLQLTALDLESAFTDSASVADCIDALLPLLRQPGLKYLRLHGNNITPADHARLERAAVYPGLAIALAERKKKNGVFTAQ